MNACCDVPVGFRRCLIRETRDNLPLEFDVLISLLCRESEEWKWKQAVNARALIPCSTTTTTKKLCVANSTLIWARRNIYSHVIERVTDIRYFVRKLVSLISLSLSRRH